MLANHHIVNFFSNVLLDKKSLNRPELTTLFRNRPTGHQLRNEDIENIKTALISAGDEFSTLIPIPFTSRKSNSRGFVCAERFTQKDASDFSSGIYVFDENGQKFAVSCDSKAMGIFPIRPDEPENNLESNKIYRFADKSVIEGQYFNFDAFLPEKSECIVDLTDKAGSVRAAALLAKFLKTTIYIKMTQPSNSKTALFNAEIFDRIIEALSDYGDTSQIEAAKGNANTLFLRSDSGARAIITSQRNKKPDDLVIDLDQCRSGSLKSHFISNDFVVYADTHSDISCCTFEYLEKNCLREVEANDLPLLKKAFSQIELLLSMTYYPIIYSDLELKIEYLRKHIIPIAEIKYFCMHSRSQAVLNNLLMDLDDLKGYDVILIFKILLKGWESVVDLHNLFIRDEFHSISINHYLKILHQKFTDVLLPVPFIEYLLGQSQTLPACESSKLISNGDPVRDNHVRELFYFSMKSGIVWNVERLKTVVDNLMAAIEKKDLEYLKKHVTIHNPGICKLFVDITGIRIPKKAGEINKILKTFVGEEQAAKHDQAVAIHEAEKKRKETERKQNNLFSNLYGKPENKELLLAYLENVTGLERARVMKYFGTYQLVYYFIEGEQRQGFRLDLIVDIAQNAVKLDITLDYETQKPMVRIYESENTLRSFSLTVYRFAEWLFKNKIDEKTST